MSAAEFSSPWWLLFAVVAAALALGYAARQRSRRRRIERFTDPALLARVAPTRPGNVRHVPVALLVTGLVVLTVALAAPTSEVTVPRNRAIVVLVLDVSLSMQATDVEPSRIAVASAAATTFATDLTPGINLGLVAFSGTASVLVPPTTDRAPVVRAIESLQLSERTAPGEGIIAALQAIDTLDGVLGGGTEPPPAHIVLLSDGKQTVPPSPDDPRGGYTAARQANTARVPVSTISFGTRDGTVDIDGENVPVPVDDDGLRETARLAGGSFFTASNLDELRSVYDTLQEQIGYERTLGDASRPWTIAGAFLITAGTAAAIALNRRLT